MTAKALRNFKDFVPMVKAIALIEAVAVAPSVSHLGQSGFPLIHGIRTSRRDQQ